MSPENTPESFQWLEVGHLDADVTRHLPALRARDIPLALKEAGSPR
jgi:hypothetical protein